MTSEELAFAENVMAETLNRETVRDLYKVRGLMAELVISLLPFEENIKAAGNEQSKRLLEAFRQALEYKADQ